MSDILSDFGYRTMVGFAGFSIGLSAMLCFHWTRDALHRVPGRWAWALAMFGYMLVIAAIFPLVIQARNINAEWTWQTWAFYVGLGCKVTAFSAMYIQRLRHKKEIPA